MKSDVYICGNGSLDDLYFLYQFPGRYKESSSMLDAETLSWCAIDSEYFKFRPYVWSVEQY